MAVFVDDFTTLIHACPHESVGRPRAGVAGATNVEFEGTNDSSGITSPHGMHVAATRDSCLSRRVYSYLRAMAGSMVVARLAGM